MPRGVLLTVDLPVSVVRLKRGRRGLGFHIGGGTDMNHIQGDSGIYVTQVKHGGAAYKDGRIKIGDRIIAIDEISLEDVAHSEAVRAFINASDTITLRVQHGAKNYILKEIDMCSGKDNRKNVERYSVASPRMRGPSRRRGFDYGLLIVFLAGCSMAAYLLNRYRPWTHYTNIMWCSRSSAPGP